MNQRANNLLLHLRTAATHMDMSYAAEKKIKLFLELRYDILNTHFSHKIFSVNQCSLDFFRIVLDILEGRAQIPSRFNEKGERKSVYEQNYIDWLEEWKAQIT